MRPLLATALGAAVVYTSGCGYSVRGKAIQGSFPAVMFVSADDPRFREPGIGGVQLTVTRNPGHLSIRTVGNGASAADGTIDIPLRDATGAGVTDEEWQIDAAGAGWSRQTALVRLPLGNDRRLLVIMTPGRPGQTPEDWPADTLTPTSFEQERNRIDQDLERFRWNP